MKKNVIFALALSLIVLALPIYCFAGSMDTFTPDPSTSDSSASDNPSLADSAGTESELLDNIKSDPTETSNYQTLANLYASENVSGFKVLVDGSLIDFSNYDNVQPVAQSGRTLVPVRAIAEALGAVVDWNGSSQTITITLGGSNVQLTVDSNEALVNNTQTTLDVPAEVINGRTLVPLRFVGTAFGEQVGWYPSGNVGVIALYN